MSDSTNHTMPHPVRPNLELKHFNKLVGTWTMDGRDLATAAPITGTVSFEWLEGGFFLLQRVQIDHGEQKIRGIEIIGYERKWGENATHDDCTSHFFDNAGNSFDYVYDVDENTITIWGGRRGSPAAFRGTFSEDRNTITGKWEWPGGGYTATMTRVI